MNLNVKFNKFERVAGVFVLAAAGGIVMSMVGVAVSQGWFESKTVYRTVFDTADGLHVGTPVQMAGLRIGAVEDIELRGDNKIAVEMRIFSKFSERVRLDSQAQLVRPFIIGERILEISVGTSAYERVEAGATIASVETADLMTILSGRKLGSALGEMGDMIKNLRYLAEAFLDKNRTEGLIKIFDRIDPLLQNLNQMSTEVLKLTRSANKDDRFAIIMREMAVTTKELNAMLPEIKERTPKVAADLEKLVSNMAILTESTKVLLPALAEIAPDLPRSSRRAVEALDETVVLLKALQKSFLLRGSAQEVRDEQKRADEARKPASTP